MPTTVQVEVIKNGTNVRRGGSTKGSPHSRRGRLGQRVRIQGGVNDGEIPGVPTGRTVFGDPAS